MVAKLVYSCPVCGVTTDDVGALGIHLELMHPTWHGEIEAGSAPIVQAQPVAPAATAGITAPATAHANGAVPSVTAAPVAPPVETATAQALSDQIDARKTAQRSLLWTPALDSHFAIPVSVARKVQTYVHRAQSGKRVNVLLRGAPGTGKTSLAMQVAAAYNRPFASIEFGRLQEPGQVFGEILYTPERGTFFQKSLLWVALETPGAVVLLDELNRAENPKVLNPLMSLLDDRGEAFIDTVQAKLRVAPDVLIFATINEGHQHVGVDPVDVAIVNRFRQITLHRPDQATAVGIIRTKTGLDQTRCQSLYNITANVTAGEGMRSLIRAAEDITDGLSFQDAIEASFTGIKGKELEDLLRRAQAEDARRTGSVPTGETEQYTVWTGEK